MVCWLCIYLSLEVDEYFFNLKILKPFFHQKTFKIAFSSARSKKLYKFIFWHIQVKPLLVHGRGTALREFYASVIRGVMNSHLIDVNFQHYFLENVLQIGPIYKFHY